MMFCNRLPGVLLTASILALAIAAGGGAVAGGSLMYVDDPPKAAREARKLSHEETLRWIAEHHAWRRARKTKPIWARPVEPDEEGREFQTADHVKEVARKGSWLCVGVAGEPWFQDLKKIEAKYVRGAEETKRFDFDQKSHTYRLFQPSDKVLNWAARVEGPGIAGFSIRPGYDPQRPLYSPAGGYVLMREVPDPYKGVPDDVWLVQESLFDSTYELLPGPGPEGSKEGSGRPGRRPDPER